MNKPRVLILDYKESSSGGGQRYLLDIVRVLKEDGWSVDVAINQHDNTDELCRHVNESGAQLHHISFDRNTATSIADDLLPLVDQIQPAIIHVNQGGGRMRPVVTNLASRDLGPARLMLTLHGPLESNEALQQWSVRDRLPFSRRRQKHNDRARFLRIFDRIISVSRYNADVAVNTYRLDAGRVVHVPNGVDVDTFSPNSNCDAKQEKTSIIVGTCGRLHQAKRGDLLIRAVASIGTGSPIELQFAGVGPEKENWSRLASDLGISQRVKFLGQQRKIPEFLRSIDIFALPSDREGLPYALLEAMACGLPSVVSSVNELPFVVRDGIEGFVVPANSAHECAQRLQQLVEDPNLRKTMGVSARASMCRFFPHGLA